MLEMAKNGQNPIPNVMKSITMSNSRLQDQNRGGFRRSQSGSPGPKSRSQSPFNHGRRIQQSSSTGRLVGSAGRRTPKAQSQKWRNPQTSPAGARGGRRTPNGHNRCHSFGEVVSSQGNGSTAQFGGGGTGASSATTSPHRGPDGRGMVRNASASAFVSIGSLEPSSNTTLIRKRERSDEMDDLEGSAAVAVTVGSSGGVGGGGFRRSASHTGLSLNRSGSWNRDLRGGSWDPHNGRRSPNSIGRTNQVVGDNPNGYPNGHSRSNSLPSGNGNSLSIPSGETRRTRPPIPDFMVGGEGWDDAEEVVASGHPSLSVNVVAPGDARGAGGAGGATSDVEGEAEREIERAFEKMGFTEGLFREACTFTLYRNSEKSSFEFKQVRVVALLSQHHKRNLSLNSNLNRKPQPFTHPTSRPWTRSSPSFLSSTCKFCPCVGTTSETRRYLWSPTFCATLRESPRATWATAAVRDTRHLRLHHPPPPPATPPPLRPRPLPIPRPRSRIPQPLMGRVRAPGPLALASAARSRCRY